MYLDASEIVRLYKLLSDELGNDTTGALFKYIDNKTERAVSAAVKTIATKEDIAIIRKTIGKTKADILKWMFFFWVGQIGVVLGIILLFLKR